MSIMFKFKKRTRASKLEFNLEPVNFNFMKFKSSFQYRASTLWNELPTEIKCVTSKEKFKSEVQHFLLMNPLKFVKQ